jgi:hypothetical protein
MGKFILGYYNWHEFSIFVGKLFLVSWWFWKRNETLSENRKNFQQKVLWEWELIKYKRTNWFYYYYWVRYRIFMVVFKVPTNISESI